MQRMTRNNGFSLTELAITIAIIGLLTMGAFAASNLGEAAKVVKIIKNVEQYRGYITAFEIKYRNLPGDMPNATAYWLEQKNGNYNGLIEKQETPWKHLVAAELIDIEPEIRIENEGNTNYFIISTDQGDILDEKQDDGIPETGLIRVADVVKWKL